MCERPSCKHCKGIFDFDNKLHEHLRTCFAIKSTISATSTVASTSCSAPKSIAPHDPSLSTRISAGSTPLKVTAVAFETPAVDASASKSQPPLKCYTSSLLLSETTPSSASPYTANSASPHTTRSAITPHPTNQATQWAANRATSRPATPPPTYRSTSPSPSAYKITRNYLTVADLYMRYAPLKRLTKHVPIYATSPSYHDHSGPLQAI